MNPYSNRAAEALLDDVLDQTVETDEIDDSFVIEDAEDAEEGYGPDEFEDVFESFSEDDANLE